MRNRIIIKIVLLTGVLIMLLQCVYVFGSYHDEKTIVTKERQVLPTPALPAL